MPWKTRKHKMPDRMSKKMADANKDLDRLFEDQERIAEKGRAANKLTNPEERKAEFAKAGPRTRETGSRGTRPAQRLTRTQAEASAQELRPGDAEIGGGPRATREREAPIEKQDDVLDRIDDAQRELERDRQKNDEELQRRAGGEVSGRHQVVCGIDNNA